MTVGNFGELLGSIGFDSISGSDLEVVYALEDDDVLNSTATFAGGSLPEGDATTILVGGSGSNDYQIRNNSTAIAIENNNSPDNILWTTIGSPGISLEDSSSFVAEIDSRHLYLGNTESDQYVILIDWQVPENQIETFDLAGGSLSYTEFASSFRQASNYRGNFTWSELAASEEIDLVRLGLPPETIDNDLAAIASRSQELESGVETNEEPDATEETEVEPMLVTGTDGDDVLTGLRQKQ